MRPALAVVQHTQATIARNRTVGGDAKKGIAITYSKGLVAVTEGLLVLSAMKGKQTTVAKIAATLRGFTPFPYLDQIKS